ncbi:hypothetical protein CPB86DRAFT_472776 [Serendipita vermifera]|nr:hypothetical protein CPB86DRAFT_472776 [Serendipita vermifera]
MEFGFGKTRTRRERRKLCMLSLHEGTISPKRKEKGRSNPLEERENLCKMMCCTGKREAQCRTSRGCPHFRGWDLIVQSPVLLPPPPLITHSSWVGERDGQDGNARVASPQLSTNEEGVCEKCIVHQRLILVIHEFEAKRRERVVNLSRERRIPLATRNQ